MSKRRTVKTALLVIGVVVVLISILAFVSRAKQRERVDLRIASVPGPMNGVIHVRLSLTNFTDRVLNIIDDSNQKPIFLIEEADGDWSWPTNLANTLTVNLNPSSGIAQEVWLTNPPTRFRFRCVLRDLEEERRVSQDVLLHLWRRLWNDNNPGPLKEDLLRPASEWMSNETTYKAPTF